LRRPLRDGRLCKQSRGVVAYSSPKFLRSVGLAMCFAAMATASDGVSFVFRGEVYRDHPTWLTVPNSLWAQFRRELGFEDAEHCPGRNLATIRSTGGL